MKHIKAFIDELKAQRALIDGLIPRLEELADPVAPPTPPPPATKKAVAKVKRTYTRRQTATAPAVAPAPAVASLDDAPTFGGAMKRAIHKLQTFTKDELAATIQREYPDTLKLVSSPEQSLNANLSYWCAKGQLEKSGVGPQASYRVRQGEFFK